MSFVGVVMKVICALFFSMLIAVPAFAGGKGNSVGKDNNLGARTSERGGEAGFYVGGYGNSDGDPTNGQAHQAFNRGDSVQRYLGKQLNIGSKRQK